MSEFRMPASWYEPPDEVDEDEQEHDREDYRTVDRWEEE